MFEILFFFEFEIYLLFDACYLGFSEKDDSKSVLQGVQWNYSMDNVNWRICPENKTVAYDCSPFFMPRKSILYAYNATFAAYNEIFALHIATFALHNETFAAYNATFALHNVTFAAWKEIFAAYKATFHAYKILCRT